MKKFLLAAAMAFSAIQADAAIITINFDLKFTDFVPELITPTGPAIDPVYLAATIVFDNSASISATTSGLTVQIFNLPTTLMYTYDASDDIISLGTAPHIGQCDLPAPSACEFIHNVSTQNLGFEGIYERTADGSVYQASTIAAVPETASWTLMVGGFGMIGSAMRSRKKAAITFA